MEDIIVKLSGLVKNLEQAGYQFVSATPVRMATNQTADSIAELEKHFPLPQELRDFYRRLDSIDFSGTPPQAWGGCEYPDPLMIDSPESALAELSDYLADTESYLEAYEVFRFPVSPDYYHKANVSGGPFYNIALSEDGPYTVTNTPYGDLALLDYLSFAIRWAGFPGLSRTMGHTWPVAQLRP
ncbi:MAG: SMI1/KNR4 family protein [Leptospirales bacterium]|nr:SMI1/KNR4 family protein [Leptospirales bacterium]